MFRPARENLGEIRENLGEIREDFDEVRTDFSFRRRPDGVRFWQG